MMVSTPVPVLPELTELTPAARKLELQATAVEAASARDLGAEVASAACMLEGHGAGHGLRARVARAKLARPHDGAARDVERVRVEAGRELAVGAPLLALAAAAKELLRRPDSLTPGRGWRGRR